MDLISTRERESKQIYRAHFTHIEFHIKSFCIFERLTYLILTLLQAVIGLSVTLNRLAPVHRHFKKHWEGKCRSESISLKISWWCVSGTQRAVYVSHVCVCVYWSCSVELRQIKAAFPRWSTSCETRSQTKTATSISPASVSALIDFHTETGAALQCYSA